MVLVPDDAPHKLTGNVLSTTEIAFSWQPITHEKRNGIITGYTLLINNMNGIVVKSLVVNASTLDMKVEGLVSWTNYTANMSCMTVKGSGPWSSKIMVTTLEEGNTVQHNLYFNNRK